MIDATCPLVTKVHIQGRRYAKAGRTLVMIGHADHAEVIGTTGQIDAPIHLVSTVEDVAALKLAGDTPIAYITQTTLSVDETRDVSLHLANVSLTSLARRLRISATRPRIGRRQYAN